MGRFAERPKAGFVAQDAQPGVIFGAAAGMRFEKSFQTGDGFGAAVDVAQVAHQRELRFAGFGKAGDGQAADFERDFVIAALADRPWRVPGGRGCCPGSAATFSRSTRSW